MRGRDSAALAATEVVAALSVALEGGGEEEGLRGAAEMAREHLKKRGIDVAVPLASVAARNRLVDELQGSVARGGLSALEVVDAMMEAFEGHRDLLLGEVTKLIRDHLAVGANPIVTDDALAEAKRRLLDELRRAVGPAALGAKDVVRALEEAFACEPMAREALERMAAVAREYLEARGFVAIGKTGFGSKADVGKRLADALVQAFAELPGSVRQCKEDAAVSAAAPFLTSKFLNVAYQSALLQGLPADRVPQSARVGGDYRAVHGAFVRVLMRASSDKWLGRAVDGVLLRDMVRTGARALGVRGAKALFDSERKSRNGRVKGRGAEG